MKRGEKVPQPYTAAQLLESMEEVGFLVFLGPGENLFVLPPYELGPQLRFYLHEHWGGGMRIVREAGGVVGVCPDCRGRTLYWSGE